MTVLIIFLWMLVGVLGYVYWWTYEYDLRLPDLVMAVLFVSWMGPLTWLVGWATMSKPTRRPLIVMRRRA